MSQCRRASVQVITPIVQSTRALLIYRTDEIALYDRQIRLWGMQAQEKIRNASILLITIKGLANEVAKNLTLSGIRSITLLDHEIVTETDLGAQFCISSEDLGKNRAEAAAVQVRKLNPRVEVIVDQENIKSKGPAFFQSFDIVIATELLPETLNVINTATRMHRKPFYAAGVHGFYGFIFADLIQHDYVLEREKSNVATTIGPETRTRSVLDVKIKKEGEKIVELVTKREVYSTWLLSDVAVLPEEMRKRRLRMKAVTPVLSCLRALQEFQHQQQGRTPTTKDDLALFTRLATEKHKALGLPEATLRSELLRKFLQNVGSEMAPVTAVLGGQLAQDVINVLGQKRPPIQNLVIFDGDTMECPMYQLHPEGELGDGLLPVSNGAGVASTPVEMAFRTDITV